ncbi:MAG: hypothetical protein R3B54_00360 [Bdellovibrionota bacterium]
MDEKDQYRRGFAHGVRFCSATRFLDLDGSFDLGRDLVEGGFTVENGELLLTGGTGLGVRLLG